MKTTSLWGGGRRRRRRKKRKKATIIGKGGVCVRMLSIQLIKGYSNYSMLYKRGIKKEKKKKKKKVEKQKKKKNKKTRKKKTKKKKKKPKNPTGLHENTGSLLDVNWGLNEVP